MKLTILILSIVLSCASCAIDNYTLPEYTVSGKIVDSQTNETIQSGGVNAGTIVKFFEDDSNQPLIFNTKPDGSFTNSKVFAGNYNYVAEGPFVMVGTEPHTIAVDGNVDVEIQAIPNVRVNTALGEVNGTTATVTLTFEKMAADQNLVNVGIVWSEFKNPNNFTFSGGSIIQENVESLGISSGERIFTIEGLKPNTKYYIRGSARTANPGNYYNYSSQFELVTN